MRLEEGEGYMSLSGTRCKLTKIFQNNPKRVVKVIRSTSEELMVKRRSSCEVLPDTELEEESPNLKEGTSFHVQCPFP